MSGWNINRPTQQLCDLLLVHVLVVLADWNLDCDICDVLKV